MEPSLEKLVYVLKDFWWRITIYIISTGIISLFIASFVYDKIITLEVMNLWVGIVLGFVALIIGIISMILSFYNLNLSIKTQEKTVVRIETLKTEIQTIIANDRSKESEKISEEKTNKSYFKEAIID